LSACARPHQPGRFAVLPFENLTGDAANDWIASAAPAIMEAELGAVRAGSVSDGYLQNAGQFVHGYFTRSGGELRFEVALEDAARHKLTEPRSYSGPLLPAMTAAVKAINPSAREFSTARADAVDAWGHREFQKATAIDPDFGAAWLAWVETLIQHGDTAQATEVADRALARTSLRSEVDRARIELLAANLHNDEPRRVKALAQLAKLTNDSAMTIALAETELNARNFPAAVSAFQNALAANPDNGSVMLSLGYAQAYAGQIDAAKATLEAYGKQPGQATNSLDSIGEAYFMNGRFTEAEKYFLQAHQSNPAFIGGGGLLKAAYAHWLAGDLSGADSIASRYFQTQKNNSWREASWLFATGRHDQAIAKLQSVPDKQLVERQMAAWNAGVPGDLPALKARYQHTPPSADGEVRTFYAAALLKAGRKDEAGKLASLWPIPLEQGVDPMLESLVFPTFLEVRRATQN